MKKKFPGAALLLMLTVIASQLFVSITLFGYNKLYGTVGGDIGIFAEIDRILQQINDRLI